MLFLDVLSSISRLVDFSFFMGAEVLFMVMKSSAGKSTARVEQTGDLHNRRV